MSQPAASIARNALHLVAGQAVTMVLGVLFSAALGRTLGARDFGVYFLVSSFSAFALVLVDWGQQYFGIREVARSPARGGEILGTGLVLRAAGTLLGLVPVALSAWLLGYDRRTTVFAVAFVAFSLPLFLAQNFAIVFRGRDRMGLDATVSVTNRAVGLVLALAALAMGLGLGGVVVTQGLAGAAALAVAFALYRGLDAGPLRWSRWTAREILGGGTAIVTMTLATNVQPYIDAVLLSKLVPKDVVGWYGAAKSIMGTLLAPSLILGAATFPRLSRAAASPPEFRRELGVAHRPMLWLGGLAAVGTWTFSDVAIRIVYGRSAFGPAADVLAVFGLGLFLVFIDVLLGTSLMALGRSGGFSLVKIGSVVLCTAAELFLVPWFQARSGNGGLGVVTAFVLAEGLLFASLLLLMPRGTLPGSLGLDAGRALAASAGTWAALRLVPGAAPWVGIPLCIAIYAVLSVATGLLRRSDLAVLGELARRRRVASTGPVEAPPASVR